MFFITLAGATFIKSYNCLMNKEIDVIGPNKNFESIKRIDENNIEYWTARELFPLFGYSRWESFDELVLRAAKAALNSGQTVENHFRQLTKMVDLGSGSLKRENEGRIRL